MTSADKQLDKPQTDCSEVLECWQRANVSTVAKSVRSHALQARLQKCMGLRQWRPHVQQGSDLSSCLSGALLVGRGRRNTTSAPLIVYCCMRMCYQQLSIYGLRTIGQ